MRYFISIIFLFSSLSGSEYNWQKVSIPNICTFKIPNTMEIQAGKYKKMSDSLQKEILEMPVNSTRVIAQQKELNSYSKQAFKTYARIMVETNYGHKGEYEKITTLLHANRQELSKLNDIFRTESEASFKKLNSMGKMKMKLLSWEPLELVVVNSVYMIKINYIRSLNNRPPVLVNIYIIQNDDRMHRVTISYRIKDKKLYKNDLDRVISTFVFNKNR